MGRSMLRGCFGILSSRCSGLARDIASAAYWGATETAQAAYSVAFSIPNSLRALFGEGAFSGAFVPLFSRLLEDGRHGEAWKLANRAITLQALLLLSITVLSSALAFALHTGLFPDTGTLPGLTLLILPLLLPFAILICAAAALNAVLNSLKSFFIPTTVQSVFNLCQVATVLYLCYFWENSELAALIIFCLSTSFAGLLELLVLLTACRKRGYRYFPDWHWRDPLVRTLCRNILPGLVGAGVNQLNSLLDKWIAMLLGAGAIGALAYSQRIVYLPVGLFGVAMGMVCLPTLSQATARNDLTAIGNALNYAMRTVLFMALPCVAFLLPCGDNIIAMLFQRGAFKSEAVSQSAFALAFYAIGVPAFCCAKIAITAFHARLDTRTPMYIALFCMALNLLLNLALMHTLRQGGLALATSLSSWCNVLLLLHFNRRHLPQWSPRPILRCAAALSLAAVFAGISASLLSRQLFRLLSPGSFLPRLLITVATLGTCLTVYTVFCLLFRRPEPAELCSLFLRRRTAR